MQPACVDALTALRTAVRQYRIPLSERRAEQRPAIDKFKASLEALANPSSCGSSQPDIRIGRVRNYLKARHEDPTGPRPPNTQGASEAAPFKDSVVLRHATDVSSSYEIQRAWRWGFDVDVATVYTEIASAVFTSVPTLNLATTEPDDTVNIVRQTDEQGRAGELTMFLSLQWRPRQGAASTFSIGPQLGAGLSTDHPAIFAGVGFGLGRYVKLGVGWNWQEVKELRNQKVDQILGLGESVQTRDAFDDGYYVSLSITLDELPFFKAP